MLTTLDEEYEQRCRRRGAQLGHLVRSLLSARAIFQALKCKAASVQSILARRKKNKVTLPGARKLHKTFMFEPARKDVKKKEEALNFVQISKTSSFLTQTQRQQSLDY